MDEYQIVELVKDWYRAGSIKSLHNFLLKDRTIISIESYERSYEYNPSISKHVIGYVHENGTYYVSKLEFPMLDEYGTISYIYLYKIGYLIRLYDWLGPAPLPNLKYITYSITGDMVNMGSMGHEFKDKLVIELVDLDVAANNLNLPKIVSSVLGPKLLSENKINIDKFYKIEHRVAKQKLFAGQMFYDAHYIASLYFDTDKHDVSKEVLKISQAYQQVFRPYRVIYNTKTWQPVVF